MIRNLLSRDGNNIYINSNTKDWENHHIMVLRPEWTIFEGMKTLKVVKEACIFPKGLKSTKKRNIFPLLLPDHYMLSDLKVPQLPDYEVDF